MDKSDQTPHTQSSNEGKPGQGEDKNSVLEEACRSSGRSLDFWSGFTEGLDEEAIAVLAERAHMIPEDASSSWEVLQRDQKEVTSLFAQIGHNDRKTMLVALRTLVGLRKTH